MKKAPATVNVWAEQKGEAPVYSGEKQEMSYVFKAKVVWDDRGLFDHNLLTSARKWPAVGA